MAKDKEQKNKNRDREQLGHCPSCTKELYFKSSDGRVKCPQCLRVSSVGELLSQSGASVNNSFDTSLIASDIISSLSLSIDNPDAIFAYIEDFFNKYNWNSYKLLPSFDIPEIKKMVETNKIKYGATPIAWRLDFEAKIVPLIKKLEGLGEQEQFFLDFHKAVDKTPFMAKYDLYEKITNFVKENIEKIFSELQADIENAKKYDADEEMLKSMKLRFNSAVELYNQNVHDFNDISEVPAAKKAIEIMRENASKKLADDGIDAQATYEKAVRLYNTYEDKTDALILFEAIRDYGDSVKYIEKINKFFNFDSKILKLASRHFLLKQTDAKTAKSDSEENEFTFIVSDKKAKKKAEKKAKKDAKKKAKKNAEKDVDEESEETEEDTKVEVQEENTKKIPLKDIKTTYSLYEVVDGKAYEPAAVTGISYPLGFYANKLFYIKRERSICSYDVLTHVETELDRGLIDDYPSLYVNDKVEAEFNDDLKSNEHRNPKFMLSGDSRSLYIKKKLSPFTPEKKGCFKSFFSIFRKKRAPFTDAKNNYSVIKVDMVNNVATTEIDRLVDITECFEDRIFYIAYRAPIFGKSRVLDMHPSFMLANLKTGEKTELLGDDCHIHSVIGDNVIYTTWDPNEYNQMLFSYNIKTDVTTLIEANIFGYYKTINDRVFYKIGNDRRCLLFSNNIDGTDRVEIMPDVEGLLTVLNGWLYVIRGEGLNTTLYKISPDGKKTVEIGSNVHYIAKISDTHTYYINFDDELHVVRADGSDDRVIAEDVTTNLIFDKDFIYYLRYEHVNPANVKEYSHSLYRMKPDGSDVKKLIFDVNAIENYDENSIYVYKSNKVRYEPVGDIEYLEQSDDNCSSNGRRSSENKKDGLTRCSYFSIYDKRTETEIPLLSVGAPNNKYWQEKRGCFRKPINHSITYRPHYTKARYKKKDIAKVGQVYREQSTINESEE